MTPKERVLKKLPKAWLWLQPGSGFYFILPRGGFLIGHNIGGGETPRQAWADAASRLVRRPTSTRTKDGQPK